MIDQGRTVADVARELGVVEQTLGNWVRQEGVSTAGIARASAPKSARSSAGSAGR